MRKSKKKSKWKRKREREKEREREREREREAKLNSHLSEIRETANRVMGIISNLERRVKEKRQSLFSERDKY